MAETPKPEDRPEPPKPEPRPPKPGDHVIEVPTGTLSGRGN